MSEYDNDRLEQFFRKAASKPDVTFNEEDWKKLEARLDAEQSASVKMKKTGSRVAAILAIAIIAGLTGAVWMNALPDNVADPSDTHRQQTATKKDSDQQHTPPKILPPDETSAVQPGEAKSEDEAVIALQETRTNALSNAPAPISSKSLQKDFAPHNQKVVAGTKPLARSSAAEAMNQRISSGEIHRSISGDAGSTHDLAPHQPGLAKGVKKYDRDKLYKQLIITSQPSPAVAEKIKQKAVVELPGAEEETRGAEAVVHEEHASEQKKHGSLPRLSLLLSFAPDFSSTSYNRYTAPGKAFGAVIHYHLRNKWSVSAGVIKNHKTYTGAGEDYTPPTGYWKYYTNGVIPNSIDGACTVVEFPLMVQYTLSQTDRRRWLAGVGVSSYFMLSESYRYNFAHPNPGAKEGWDSRSASRFFFNMANFTIGYERRLIPNLMVGIEPYIKVPLEEIGWSNLKLFSTGASFTMRYTIVRRQAISTPARSRGPD